MKPQEKLVGGEPAPFDQLEGLTQAVIEAVLAELAESSKRALGRIEIFRRELDRQRGDWLAESAQDGFLVTLDVDLAERRKPVALDQCIECRNANDDAIVPFGIESAAGAHTLDPLVGHGRNWEPLARPAQLGFSGLAAHRFRDENRSTIEIDQPLELGLQSGVGLDGHDRRACLQEQHRPVADVRADVECQIAFPDELPVERDTGPLASHRADAVAKFIDAHQTIVPGIAA
ncbi:MAG TPA: hypothetical protein VMU73_05475 [Gaiellaceae bacterium]|nr:hypothetical protein [Gaiellaceae bacterium]